LAELCQVLPAQETRWRCFSCRRHRPHLLTPRMPQACVASDLGSSSGRHQCRQMRLSTFVASLLAWQVAAIGELSANAGQVLSMSSSSSGSPAAGATQLARRSAATNRTRGAPSAIAADKSEGKPTWTEDVRVSVDSRGHIRSVAQHLPHHHVVEAVASDSAGDELDITSDASLLKEAAAAAGAAAGAAAAIRAVSGPVEAAAATPAATTAPASPQAATAQHVEHRISKSTLILLQLGSVILASCVAWRNVKKLFTSRRAEDEADASGSRFRGAQLRVSLKTTTAAPTGVPARGRPSITRQSQSSGSGSGSVDHGTQEGSDARETPGSPDRGGGG